MSIATRRRGLSKGGGESYSSELQQRYNFLRIGSSKRFPAVGSSKPVIHPSTSLLVTRRQYRAAELVKGRHFVTPSFSFPLSSPYLYKRMFQRTFTKWRRYAIHMSSSIRHISACLL